MVVAVKFGGLDGHYWGVYTTKAAGTIVAGAMVKAGTDGVIHATDDSTGIAGIALNAAVDGGLVNVASEGIFIMDLDTGFDPDVGDRVFPASHILVDAGDASDYSCGIVVRSDPASAGTAHVKLVARESCDSYVYA